MAKQNPQEPIRRRKRRPRGVPKALVAILIALSLLAGGAAGFILGGRSGDKNAEQEALLASAEQRIGQLETALELMGHDPHGDFLNELTPLVDDPAAVALEGNQEGLPNNDALIAENDALNQDAPGIDADPVVVAEFGDQKIMSDEVLELYNARVNQLMLMGQDVSQYANSLMEDALTTVVTERVKALKAAEFGLDTLTGDDKAAIDRQAQEDFDALVDFYVVDDAGANPDEQKQAAIEMLAEEGTTLESLREQIEDDWRERKLSDHISQNLALSDQQIQEAYDAALADQQDRFAASPEDYEFARRYGDESVVYNPEGYRTFKQILIPFSLEDSIRAEEIQAEIAGLDPAADADRIDTLNGELQTLYAALQSAADEVLDRIAQGENFDALLAEYGQDPEQNDPSVQANGYYVCENSTSYDAEIVRAAMALAKVGDISDPIRTTQGVHILRYNSDVTPGPVPLETVRDAVAAEALENLKYEAYEAQLHQWIEEANITYHREALQ